MANYNKVVFVGRLTADPEIRTTGSGLKVAGIRFAVTNRKKNPQTQQWEDDPMYIDISAFDRGPDGGNATTVERFCKKGSQILVEGKLTLDTWEDKNGGGKRSKHKVLADTIQLLDSRGSGGPGGDAGDEDGMAEAPAPRRPASPPAGRGPSAPPPRAGQRPPAKPAAHDDDEYGGGNDDGIPF